MGSSKIVLVKTCERYIKRRRACESTWAQNLPTYFACGSNGDDDYKFNSLKVKEALAYLLKNVSFDFVFVCDDDTFIHPERWLHREPQGKMEGLLIENQKRCQGCTSWYQGGAGWFMHRKVCEMYVRKVRMRTSADDVQACRVAGLMKVKLTNRPNLYSFYSDERVSVANKLITCHYVDPKEMKILYENRNGNT